MNIKRRRGFTLSKGIDYIVDLAKGSDKPFRKKQAVVGVGENGTAKTSRMVAKLREVTGKEPVVFNCAFHGEEMVGLPNFNMEDRTSEMFINSNLLKIDDDGKAHAIIIDEFGKGSRVIKRNMSSLAYDRTIGGRKIPDDCIVVALTNYGSEGLGDSFDPHEMNRATFVHLRKDTAEVHLEEYGYSRYEPELIAWVLQNPDIATSFLDLDTTKVEERKTANPLGVFDPKVPSGEKQYLSYRSLESADTNLKLRHVGYKFEDIMEGLIGSVGELAANSIRTMIQLSDKLPNILEVEADPENCNLPADGAASSLLLHKLRDTTQVLNDEGVLNPDATRKRIGSYLKYLRRMKADHEAQFVKSIAKDTRVKSLYSKHADFQDLAIKYGFLSTADK